MKAWKVQVSGTYYTGNDEIIDFDLEGTIPGCIEDEIHSHMINRYVPMWLREDKEGYPDRVNRVREVFVEDYAEADAEFSFVGKDVRDMDYNELQDFAVAKGLRDVPLYKVGARSHQREVAYVSYLTNVQKSPPDDQFNLRDALPLIADAKLHAIPKPKYDPDKAVLKEEGGEMDVSADMSLEELRKIAKGMGLSVKANASKKTVLQMIQGK